MQRRVIGKKDTKKAKNQKNTMGQTQHKTKQDDRYHHNEKERFAISPKRSKTAIVIANRAHSG